MGEGDGAGPGRLDRVGEGDGVGPLSDVDGTGAGTGVVNGYLLEDGEGLGVAEPEMPDGEGVGLRFGLCADAWEWASDLAVPWSEGAARATLTPPATTTTAAGAATHHCLRDNNLIRNLRLRLTGCQHP